MLRLQPKLLHKAFPVAGNSILGCRDPVQNHGWPLWTSAGIQSLRSITRVVSHRPSPVDSISTAAVKRGAFGGFPNKLRPNQAAQRHKDRDAIGWSELLEAGWAHRRTKLSCSRDRRSGIAAALP